MVPDRKVALVTGANKGIGREVALRLAEGGYTVFLRARDEELGRLAAAELAGAPGDGGADNGSFVGEGGRIPPW